MRNLVNMSRIGKKTIEIPNGVQVRTEKEKIIAQGPNGEMSFEFAPEIKIEINNNLVTISPKSSETKTVARKTKQIRALWGLTRNVIANMVEGVSKGFDKKLQIEGLGFRANVEGNRLILKVGYTHLVNIEAPPGIKFLVEKNIITVSGADKALVGLVAAKIKKVQKPEPYKGKGIRYLGEEIKRKEGKKAASTTM